MSVVDVIVAGHLCLDMHPEMDHIALNTLASPGRLFETGALRLATGGAVANTGLSLYRLGINVRLMAKVGDDFIGQAIGNVIASHNPALNQYIKVLPGQPSSYTIVLTPERSDRIFLHCTGPNANFGVADVDFDLLHDAKIFHLGYPSLLPRLFADEGSELLAILQGAKGSGVVTSMDMTLPDPNSASGQVDWRKIFSRVLPYTDIFIPSIEEIVFCLRRSDYDAWKGDVLTHISAAYLFDLADELISMGGVIVGFKLGQFGFYIKTAAPELFARLGRLHLNVSEWAEKTVWSPAFQVEMVGTTGAGDSAYAGFLGALLRGMPPDTSAKWACAVGACNVEAADSLSGVPPWETIQARLDNGWSLRQERLNGIL